MKPLGPRSRRTSIDRLDKRTHEARFLKRMRAELARNVGENPTFAQKEMIDLAAMLALRIKIADAKFSDDQSMSEVEARSYQGFCSAYARMLLRLKIEPPDAPRPDASPNALAEYIKMKSQVAAEVAEK